jgi:hypothetical protein
LVEFSASQTLTGISYDTFISDSSYALSVSETVAACITGVTADMVTNVEATDPSATTSARPHVYFRVHKSASSDSVDISYLVSAYVMDATYESLTMELNENIENDVFNGYLTQYGNENGAYELAGVQASTASTTNVNSNSAADDDNLSGGAIAGIVIGVIAFVVIVAAIIFFVVGGGFGTGSSSEKQVAAPATGSSSSTYNKSAPAVQSNPVFGISAISNSKTAATPIEDSNM